MKVSVIVVAQNRKTYIKEAVQSALDQTAPKESYEIIVVKNFKDAKIDRFMAKNGVKNIYSEDQGTGPKMVQGVKAAKNEIIALMDDDDKFARNRIEVLLKEFASGELGLYHNRAIMISEDGRIMQDPSKQSPYDRFYITPGEKLTRRQKLILAADGAYNTTSIAIRKEYLKANLKMLGKLKITGETILFASAFMGGKPVLIDSQFLTYYRVAKKGRKIEGKTELEAFIIAVCEYTKKINEDTEMILNAIPDNSRTRTFRDLIAFSAADNRIWQSLYAPFCCNDRRFAPRMQDYLALLFLKFKLSDVLVVLAALSPKPLKMKAIEIRYRNYRKAIQ